MSVFQCFSACKTLTICVVLFLFQECMPSNHLIHLLFAFKSTSMEYIHKTEWFSFLYCSTQSYFLQYLKTPLNLFYQVCSMHCSSDNYFLNWKCYICVYWVSPRLWQSVMKYFSFLFFFLFFRTGMPRQKDRIKLSTWRAAHFCSVIEAASSPSPQFHRYNTFLISFYFLFCANLCIFPRECIEYNLAAKVLLENVSVLKTKSNFSSKGILLY